MIPKFNINGHLPPGIHKSSLEDFRQKFVIDFLKSITRKTIYNGYMSYCKDVINHEVVLINWIAGSFTTNKLDPNDIDIVVHFNPNLYNSIIDQLEFEVNFQYKDKNDIKKVYYCHAFYVPVYPKNDPRHVLTVAQSNQWKGFFSQDRSKNDRGFIEIDIVGQKDSILNEMEL